MHGEIPNYGSYVEADENGIRFDTEQLDLSEEAAHVIQSAIYGKLTDSAIRPNHLPALLPHLREIWLAGRICVNHACSYRFSLNRTG